MVEIQCCSSCVGETLADETKLWHLVDLKMGISSFKRVMYVRDLNGSVTLL